MNFKYWKLMFMIMLMSSIMIAISSHSWMSIWLALEINMMSIIPLMNNNKNMMNTESSIKYFTSQLIASSILLMSIIMTNNIMEFNMMMMNTAILMKLGAAPMHFWFPEVMEGQKWTICLLILTTQKIIPFMLLNYNMNNINYFMIIIILNMMISMFLGLNQTSLRKIITYSSINHIAWMMSILIYSKLIWMIYFTIYSLTMILFLSIMNNYNIYYVNQLMKMNLNFKLKLLIMMMFFSMAGLPPFLGFLPKWLTIQNLIMSNLYFISTIMVILTLFTMYYYIRLMLTMLMFNNINIINNKTNSTYITMNLLLLTLLPYCMMFMI